MLRLRYCCCLLRLGVIPGRLRSRRQELRSGFPDDASVLLPDAGRLADAPHNKDRVLCTSGRSFGTTSVAGFGDAFGRRIGCCGWVVIPGRLRSRRQELRSGFPDDASVLLPDAGRLADAPHNKDRVLCTSGRSFGTTSVAGFGDAFGRRIECCGCAIVVVCCGWVSYPDGYVHAGRSCGAAFPMMRPCCSLTQGGSQTHHMQTHHMIRIECCVHLVGRSGRRPLLDSGMRSGEGSSAAVALLLLSAAVGCHTRTATFTQAGVAERLSR